MLTKLTFEESRKAYGGSKNGLENEYANFVYRAKNPLRGQPKYNPDEAVKLLLPAIEALKEERSKLLSIDQFVPSWAMFGTWINQQRWTKDCGAKRLEKQRADAFAAKRDKYTRDLYSDWIPEQEADFLREWSKSQSPRIQRLVCELRPEIDD